MALSHSTTKELQQELANLRRIRKGLEARISGIKAILASERAGPRTRPIPAATHQHKAVPTTKRSSGMHGAGGKREPLRATVSAVIQRTPGLKSGQVTQVLKEAGFSVRGKTSLRERVYHELYRLVQLGVMRKDPKGGYVVAGTHQASKDAPDDAPIAGLELHGSDPEGIPPRAHRDSVTPKHAAVARPTSVGPP